MSIVYNSNGRLSLFSPVLEVNIKICTTIKSSISINIKIHKYETYNFDEKVLIVKKIDVVPWE